MSQSRNQYEAERWLLTAEEDLRAAETLSSAEIYSLACFHAQQAGGEGGQGPVAADRRGPVGAFRQEIDYRFSAEG